MRKLVALLGIISLLFPLPSAFCQTPSAVAADLMSTAGAQMIGVVAATKGKVEVMTTGQVGRVVQSGEEIFIGDQVKTDTNGHLQILLRDQTVFTIGPNSRIVIDEFVYDPKTRDGKIRASIPKGIFRYVSGKIAAKKPSNVSVKLPTATIGFRGTIVGGEVRPDNSALVALLGPGDQNDAGERSGSFVIDGTGGGGQQ